MTDNNYRARYEKWLGAALGDPALLTELESIEQDDSAIFDRFYKDLEFGTAGLRGVIGVGTNRMNIVTVGRATAGLAAHVKRIAGETASVAIAYDNRVNSDVFARRAASVLAAVGVRVHIFPEMAATPVLSFAVRQLHCTAGIVVTASHNPSDYNGFKVYGPDGGQLDTAASEGVYGLIQGIDPFGVLALDFAAGLESGLIHYIDDVLIDDYLTRCRALITHPNALKSAGLAVVYTPLYGTGMKPVERLMEEVGLKNFHVVPEQRDPDGRFPTAPYPNPEDPAALALALKLAGEKAADIVVATDPDADRLSVAVAYGGDFVQLSGNQMGCLLLDYLAAGLRDSGHMPQDPVAIRSVVSTPMFDVIAEHYGITPIAVLTGFKNMARQMQELDKLGRIDRFVFAFEESNGFMPGSFVRDKDGISAALLFTEMAAVERQAGRTLFDRLDDLYRRFGYCATRGHTFAYPGAVGMETMANIMSELRADPPDTIGDFAVARVDDYREGFHSENLVGDKMLPATDMLIFHMKDGSQAIVRPSGTEPKLKLYVVHTGVDAATAADLADKLADDFAKILAQ